MDFIKLLEIVEHLMAALFLVAALLWLFGQTWIREWIKGRFAEAVGKELESHKHELNRELENHKSSLLRELEQFRANIDLKRSIALQHAQSQIDAMNQLYVAYNDELNMMLACARTQTKEAYAGALEEQLAKSQVAQAAYRRSDIYLSGELRRRVSGLRVRTRALMDSHKAGAKPLPSDDPELVAILQENNQIDELLKAEINKVGV
jgi:hypothetical protein